MDIGTLLVLASLLFGAVVGDAVVFGKTMRVDVTLPKSVESHGFTQDAAENMFISEFARLSDIPFILPFPTVAQASKDSLLSVVAKPLKIDPIVELLQDKFGSERVTMKLVMIDGDGNGNSELHALITDSNGLVGKVMLAGPERAPSALVEAMARRIASDTLPYRVALTYYNEGLRGQATGFSEARDLANKTLQLGFDKTKATQRAMLFNVLGLVTAQEGNFIAADERFADGMQVPVVSGTARAIIAANRAMMALSRKDAKAARAFHTIAMAEKTMPYLDYFDQHLVIIDGLIRWAEGDLDGAEAQFLAVERYLLGDTALTYRAELLRFSNRTEEANALTAKAAFLKTIRNQHPDLIGSVFWVDPIAGGLRRR